MSSRIVSRSFRQPLSADANCIAVAGQAGAWLRLHFSILHTRPEYRRDWNSAAALYELIHPGHGLSEEQAGSLLRQKIETHCQVLDWPRILLTGDGKHMPSTTISLHHALTTFVALAKSTGSIWMRARPPRLGPLHSPAFVEPGETPFKGVRWAANLWFPGGVPENLLNIARKQS